MRLLLVIGLSLISGPVWAGCSNYTDGSLSSPAPRVMICFDGKCEETTQDYTCGNVHGAQLGYANGWRLAFSDEADIAFLETADGRKINRLSGREIGTRLTCMPIVDEWGDACFYGATSTIPTPPARSAD